MITDKPYGVLAKDGNVPDKEIPDDQIESICKKWFELSSANATFCVRLHEWQLWKWREGMMAAGITVEQYVTRTIKDLDRGRWQKKLGTQQLANGDHWLIGHKVLCSNCWAGSRGSFTCCAV